MKHCTLTTEIVTGNVSDSHQLSLLKMYEKGDLSLELLLIWRLLIDITAQK
jgi:hypothetical protein